MARWGSPTTISLLQLRGGRSVGIVGLGVLGDFQRYDLQSQNSAETTFSETFRTAPRCPRTLVLRRVNSVGGGLRAVNLSVDAGTMRYREQAVDERRRAGNGFRSFPITSPGESVSPIVRRSRDKLFGRKRSVRSGAIRGSLKCSLTVGARSWFAISSRPAAAQSAMARPEGTGACATP